MSSRGTSKSAYSATLYRIAMIILVTLLVGLTIYMWKMQERVNLTRMEVSAASKARYYSSETEIRYRRIYQALAQLAAHGTPYSQDGFVRWEADTVFYINAFPGIETVSWVDQAFLIREIVPFTEGRNTQGQPATTLQQTASHIFLWLPIWEEGTFGGFIVGRISLNALMQPVVDEIGNNYAFQLSKDGESLVQSERWDDAITGSTIYSTLTLLESGVLTMSLAPTTALRNSAILSARWMLYAGLLIIFIGGTGFYAVQVSKRMKLHGQLKSHWANMEAILDGIPHIIYVVDPDSYEVLFVNQHLRNLLDKDPVGGKCYQTLQALAEPCSFCTNDILHETKAPHSWERFEPTLNRHFMITDRLIQWSNRSIARLELAIDITEKMDAEAERQEMEAYLRQSQKLESIGTLASGVAHEINNPLMGMINYADLIASKANDETIKEYSQVIMNEGDRIATIVRNLLSFSRQDKEAHSPARIVDIIDKSLSLVGSTLRKDQITLDLDLQKDLPQVKCRSQQIQQVMINLLSNSHDALNERYPEYDEDKLIRITTRSFEKEGETWIRITVEDHGSGIPKSVSQRIFDPFFTTKPKDKGTGLGLSVSFGIVREHHGELTMESVPDEFTRVHMDLRVNNGWSHKINQEEDA